MILFYMGVKPRTQNISDLWHHCFYVDNSVLTLCSLPILFLFMPNMASTTESSYNLHSADCMTNICSGDCTTNFWHLVSCMVCMSTQGYIVFQDSAMINWSRSQHGLISMGLKVKMEYSQSHQHGAWQAWDPPGSLRSLCAGDSWQHGASDWPEQQTADIQWSYHSCTRKIRLSTLNNV